MREDALITNFKNKQPAAFIYIYNNFNKDIYNFCKGMVEDKELARDFTQDVFMKLWMLKNPAFTDLKGVKNFLLVTARNAIIDHFRARTVQANFKKEAFASGEESELTEDFDLAMYQATLLSRISKAIEQLPTAQKNVFKLTFYEKLSPEEIALLLNMKIKSVWELKYRSLKVLRGLLKAVYVLLIMRAIMNISGAILLAIFSCFC